MPAPLIGLIVKNSKGKFIPLIGNKINSSNVNDQVVDILGTQPPQDTLEAATKFLTDEHESLAEMYLTPIGPIPDGIIWVSQLGEDSKGKPDVQG